MPDYYATLGVASTSSSDEIRQAYKRESLRSHPDRFPNASSSEKQRHTARFQSLADEYYVLSDTTRRAEYDNLRRSQNFGSSYASSMPPGGFSADPEKEQESSYQFFKSFFSGASGAAPDTFSQDRHGSSGTGAQPQGKRKSVWFMGLNRISLTLSMLFCFTANGVFSDVFEELLRPEVHRVAPIWKWVGAASGTGLGFILGSVPGAVGGALLGGTLGKVRDAKGKSVAEVFMGLGANQRAEIIKALAAKVLGSMG